MSDPEREREEQAREAKGDAPSDPDEGAEAEEDEEDTPSPFDHPAFLPVLLWGLALWFGYDGWLNPDMADHRTFNQVGFGVLALLGVYFTIQWIRETRAPRSPED